MPCFHSCTSLYDLYESVFSSSLLGVCLYRLLHRPHNQIIARTATQVAGQPGPRLVQAETP